MTLLGILGGFAQAIGFARWPFLVPVLSDQWAAGDARETVATTYDAFNAYAGGAIGEHLGFVLQSAWGVGLGIALRSRVATGLAAATLVLAYATVVTADLEAVQGPVYSVWVAWLVVTGFRMARGQVPAVNRL